MSPTRQVEPDVPDRGDCGRDGYDLVVTSHGVNLGVTVVLDFGDCRVDQLGGVIGCHGVRGGWRWNNSKRNGGTCQGLNCNKL